MVKKDFFDDYQKSGYDKVGKVIHKITRYCDFDILGSANELGAMCKSKKLSFVNIAGALCDTETLSNVTESGAMCVSEILKNVNVGGAMGDFDV
jgi:hypothetical protein